jgi:plasmid stabilization system protein ParE
MSRIDFVTGAPEKYAPLLEELSAIPDRAERLVATHTARDMQRAPAEDEWSADRVLAHMISYAIHNGEFINQIAWMTDPCRRPWDEDTEGWTNKSGATLAETLRSSIGETIELLSGTPDASWGRPGIVPDRGRRSLRQQLRAHIDHLVEHIDQAEESLAALQPTIAAS